MKMVALSGGVGGARLLDGLAAVLAPGALTAVVNTGDDFVHWGLAVSPDVDTVVYTLSGLADEARGWGLRGETWNALETVRRLGGEDWFALGDRDLGLHLERTRALFAGETLTAITARVAARLGVSARILPMCDRPRRTVIVTDEGALGFQEWFVKRRAQPSVRAVRFEGETRASDDVLGAIEAADAIVIGPSNPYVSIDPILTLDGVRDALARRPVIAVSPIVGGRAVKGPLAEMIGTLAHAAPSAGAIVAHYAAAGVRLRGFVVERGDEAGLALPVLATAAVMRDRDDRRRLAAEVLAFAERLA
jgi:LPPG:FO 2-phospho-L-lactate transferase